MKRSENVDAFLALEGIDGLFVGPSDFSIAWTKGERYDAKNDGLTPIFRDIADRCCKAGKFACSFGLDGAHARFLASLGFQFVAVGTDMACIKGGANALAAAARG